MLPLKQAATRSLFASFWEMGFCFMLPIGSEMWVITAGVAPASADTGVQQSDAVKEQPRVDPVLEHLLSGARSDAVRQEFLAQNSVEDLVEEHSLSLLVGAQTAAPHSSRAHVLKARRSLRRRAVA